MSNIELMPRAKDSMVWQLMQANLRVQNLEATNARLEQELSELKALIAQLPSDVGQFRRAVEEQLKGARPCK